MSNNFYNEHTLIIKKWYASKDKSITDSSIKTYLQAFKKLSKELFNSNKPNLQYLRDHESIIEYLDKEVKSLSTRKSIGTSILVILKCNKDKITDSEKLLAIYTEYHKKLALLQNETYLDNERTEREEENWITGAEIKKKIKSLEKIINKKDAFKGTPRMFCDLIQQYTVLQLYTILPPIRLDWGNVIVIENAVDPEKPLKNILNLKTNNLFLVDYKTKKSYGTKKIEIPNQLMVVIKKFQEAKKDFNITCDALLINTTNKEPMKMNSLTKYINKIFKPKKVSITLLRKMYLSEKYPVTETMRNRQEDSYIMGHSVNTQQLIYSKKI